MNYFHLPLICALISHIFSNYQALKQGAIRAFCNILWLNELACRIALRTLPLVCKGSRHVCAGDSAGNMCDWAATARFSSGVL